MAERTWYKRTLSGFVPASDSASEFFKSCSPGQLVEMKGSRPRNAGYHRLFFAILDLIAENSEPEISPKRALYFAKMAADCGEWVSTKHGLSFDPGSISFAKMDQTEFKDFVRTAIAPLCKRFLNGTAPDDVIAEVMSLVE